jgi:L-amino acid N-acyltransferase
VGRAAATVRRAGPADLPAITSIYNQAVARTVATFDTEPRSEGAARSWWEHHGDRYPVLVAVQGDKVVGWASLSAWSDRRAYDGTAEVSEYVDEAARGDGVGTLLLGALLDEARRAEFHVLLARVAGGNEASLKLHHAHGFRRVGVMHEVGRKFGRWVDVEVLERPLP